MGHKKSFACSRPSVCFSVRWNNSEAAQVGEWILRSRIISRRFRSAKLSKAKALRPQRALASKTHVLCQTHKSHFSSLAGAGRGYPLIWCRCLGSGIRNYARMPPAFQNKSAGRHVTHNRLWRRGCSQGRQNSVGWTILGVQV